ncbi:hypothetical protein THRCLA_21819 [Thraustotheca clavata]|uniref:RanBP2-type domain-containing protein n=1 Tax=Thraustotheca clavata TaxID=74557 RepID=A0A1V9ZNE7_9STRA|nr:hypothetical protein THRCLA_21819 [Thraustotheca clavata]
MNRQRRPRPQRATNGPSNTVNSSIRPGMSVAIVKKLDQPTGRLTYGIVAETLTNSAQHHRGIKVRLTDGSVGRVQRILEGTRETREEYVQEPLNSSSSTMSLSDFIRVRASRTIDDEEERDEKSSWTCSMCTFINSGFLVACEMCECKK